MLYLKRKRKFRKDRIESTMHMKRIDFENGTITGNILGAALPMLIAQILNLLYNIVDRIYIARIPEQPLSARSAYAFRSLSSSQPSATSLGPAVRRSSRSSAGRRTLTQQGAL